MNKKSHNLWSIMSDENGLPIVNRSKQENIENKSNMQTFSPGEFVVMFVGGSKIIGNVIKSHKDNVKLLTKSGTIIVNSSLLVKF